MKITLLARSSTGGSYEIEFLTTENSVRVFCHCQAGVLQQMCKHKLALINGDRSMLFDPKQAAILSEIHAWSQFSELKKRTGDYERELKRIATAKSELVMEEKEIKARFAHGLTHGFK